MSKVAPGSFWRTGFPPINSQVLVRLRWSTSPTRQTPRKKAPAGCFLIFITVAVMFTVAAVLAFWTGGRPRSSLVVFGVVWPIGPVEVMMTATLLSGGAVGQLGLFSSGNLV